MNAFSKKILSAFIDISTEGDDKIPVFRDRQHFSETNDNRLSSAGPDSRFAMHFDKLFADANLPGPSYFEFSRMVAAMQAIPNEQSRYCAAFAGLQVQGLSKEKLLASTQQYLQVLDDDSTTFRQSVSTAFEEKVGSKRESFAKAQAEIQSLSQRILQLQEQATQLTAEIAENEAKIQSSNNSYNHAMDACKKGLLQHLEKINQYIL